MRIISGIHKGRRFYPPKSIKARPTTDFAKENLFNILNNFTDWEDLNALDLFGGTGSISFELVSRGCPQVICVESNSMHIAFIEKTKSELRATELTVIRSDVFKYLKNSKQQFNFIFADPPYDLKNFEDVPQAILDGNFMSDDSIFILEHPKRMDFSHLNFYKETRTYGSVNFSIFTKG